MISASRLSMLLSISSWRSDDNDDNENGSDVDSHASIVADVAG